MTKIMPEITGDTEKGMSISVVRNDLPQNSYLATAQAAQTPNTRLSGTAIAATSSVSRIAAAPAGSVKAAKKAPSPFDSACVNTVSNGSSSNAARNSTAIANSGHLTQAASQVGRDYASGGS